MLRDGLIAGATFVYLLGYYSWATFAHAHELGVMPALDAQYLAAGLFPAAVLVAFLTSIRLLRDLGRWTQRVPGRWRRTAGSGASGLALLLILISGWATEGVKSVLIIAALVLFYGSFLLLGAKAPVLMRRFTLFLVWAYTILGGLWLISGYFDRWFARLPQAFGGPAPSCVVLDVDTSQLSADTQRLIGAGPKSPPPRVARTVELDLIAVSAGSLVLRSRQEPTQPEEKAAEAGQGQPPARPVPFRLRESTVRARLPCPQGA
jgi:hypothetical protein